MATIQLIRRRIKSTKSIRQITKAMEMVAVSKLRRAQEATLRSRTYAIGAREALARLRQRAHAKDHPLFRSRVGNRRLVVLFTSDRGLAGAYNTNLARSLLSLISESSATPLQAIVIGQKGAQFVSKMAGTIETLGVYTQWPALPSSVDIRPIAATVLDRFIARKVDRVTLIYTDFISTIRQNVVVRDILPIDPAQLLAAGARLDAKSKDVIFEPSPAEVFNYIVPRLIEVQLYQAALEAATSEAAMRMMAMKNASDNAKDLISNLTLTYNGARQSAITQELAEITAGAEAIH